MKLHLTLVGLSLALATVSGAAYAGTKDLVSICSSARLSATDKKECRAQFKTAETDADRTAIFKAFDNKMNGFTADGERITAKDEAVQNAQAK